MIPGKQVLTTLSDVYTGYHVNWVQVGVVVVGVVGVVVVVVMVLLV